MDHTHSYLFESNPMPMWIFDLATFRFRDVNDAATNHYGYSRDEFLSMTVLDIRPEEDIEAFKNARHPINIKPAHYNRGIWRHRKKDGSIIYVEIIAHDIEFEGQPARFIQSNDITARVMVEQELQLLNAELELRVEQRTAQLEALNKEMESFSYSVSHDLRAPLRAIVGYTSMLEEDHADKLDDEVRRVTSVIKRNTLKMGQLIDGLLAFSHTTRKDIVKTTVRTAKLVEDIIHEHPAWQQVEWAVGDLPDVPGDYNTIRQVWTNLISNAVKYSAKHSRPRVEIGHSIQNKAVIFYVKDNGVGFDNRYREKLFKVFQRLHSSHQFEGTGIGLALVDKIVSKHGGRVWADAEVGKGAIFSFSLPVE